MAIVEKGDIIRRIADNTIFQVPINGKLNPGFEFIRGTAQASTADRARPMAPAEAVKPEDSANGLKDPEDKHVVMEGKKKKQDDIVELFKSPDFDSYYDGAKLEKQLAVVTTQPGLMAKEDAKIVSEALQSAFANELGNTNPETMKAAVMGMLQLALTHSTSNEADYAAETCQVTLDIPATPKLRGETVRDTVVKAVSGKPYDNPLRQYLRHFAPTTVWLIKNKKLMVNEKVMAQHGVISRFVSKCFDFSRPDYSTYSPNDIRAWQLALKEAVSRKQINVNTTLHNTSELRS